MNLIIIQNLKSIKVIIKYANLFIRYFLEKVCLLKRSVCSHPLVVIAVFSLDGSEVLLNRVKLVLSIVSLGLSHGGDVPGVVLVDLLDLLLLLASSLGHVLRDFVDNVVNCGEQRISDVEGSLLTNDLTVHGAPGISGVLVFLLRGKLLSLVVLVLHLDELDLE